MINFKFFACEPRVYYPLRNPYYIDLSLLLMNTMVSEYLIISDVEKGKLEFPLKLFPTETIDISLTLHPNIVFNLYH